MDEQKAKELEMVKVSLRAVLTSFKEGVQAHVLQREYRELTFESCPYQKFGYSNLDSFIESMPDVVRISRTPTGEVYHAVADESTKHISKMVSKQRNAKKSKKLKPLRRRPNPRSAPFISPWRQSQSIVLQPVRPWPGKRPPKHKPSGSQFMMGTHMTIQTDGSRRKVVNFSGPAKNLLPTPPSQKQGLPPTNKTYELPPRFRKQQTQQQPQQQTPACTPAPKKASPPRTSLQSPSAKAAKKPLLQTNVQSVNLDKVKDKKIYYDTVVEYCRANNLEFSFKTIPNRFQNMYCYASSTMINDRMYGSGDLFGSSVEAEFEACKTACQELSLLQDSPNFRGASDSQDLQAGADNHQLKTRIKEMLQSKPNGLWSSRLPIEYKERYKEDPPGNLSSMVKSWKDIAYVEYNNLTNMEVFYPVKDAPEPVPVPKHDPPVLNDIPLPVQKDSQRKDYKIPPGKFLPLGENTVVYITYFHNASCFCVQLEDSPIDEIAEGLLNLAQDEAPDSNDLIKGRNIAALYEGEWFRAEIISDATANSTVEVLYVDFGNDDKCPTCDTRWLSEKLASYPTQAVYCSLCGIQPLKGEETWSPDLPTKFTELVNEAALVAITQSYTEDGICEVQLYLKDDMTVSINQKLINLGLVRGVTDDEESLPDTEPETLVLPEENEWDVYVSFINQTSTSVVIRLVGDNYSDKLEDLEDKLEKSYQESNTEFRVEEDELYIALEDEAYHRVRVLSKVDDNQYECYFVDHGDTDKLQKDQLRPLSSAINKLLPYQAVEISLYGLEELAYNPTTIDKLRELALAKCCIAQVISREEGISVILYDTDQEVEMNINEVIAKAVMEETETRMMAEGEFNPASISTETSPVKNVSSLTTNIAQALNALDIGDNQIENSTDIEKVMISKNGDNDGDDSDASWETEEEEEVEPSPVQLVKKSSPSVKKDKNDNTVSTVSNVENPQSSKRAISPSDSQNLYTWRKSSPSEQLDYMDDNKALWDSKLYWKRPLPPKLEIPEPGAYFDVHVCQVFSPVNFVSIPYSSMTDFDQMLRDCIEYFNSNWLDKILPIEDVKVGHLYAGHQGGSWYRVLITKIVGPGLVSVYIVDFGEFSAMALEEIKPLPWRFWSLPFQAFKCKLHGIVPPKGTRVWSEGAKLKIRSMALDKDLVGLVCDKLDNGTVSLRLVDTSTDEDICLDESLLDLGMADIES